MPSIFEGKSYYVIIWRGRLFCNDYSKHLQTKMKTNVKKEDSIIEEDK